MTREADRVAGDLAWACVAEPQPHHHAGLFQPGEEPRLIACVLRRPGDYVPEHGARCRIRQTTPREPPWLRAVPAPSAAQLGQGQVGGQLPAAIPDDPA